jgi:hypothetical protein
MLFDEPDPAARDAQRTSPVAKAGPSPAAQRKAARKRTEPATPALAKAGGEPLPVHSFHPAGRSRHPHPQCKARRARALVARSNGTPDAARDRRSSASGRACSLDRTLRPLLLQGIRLFHEGSRVEGWQTQCTPSIPLRGLRLCGRPWPSNACSASAASSSETESNGVGKKWRGRAARETQVSKPCLRWMRFFISPGAEAPPILVDTQPGSSPCTKRCSRAAQPRRRAPGRFRCRNLARHRSGLPPRGTEGS